MFRLIKTILTAEQKRAAFRQIFMQPFSDEYRCADGMLAKDLDIQDRGNCREFRDDASWTFNSMERVSDARRMILLATASNSQYSQNLRKSRGIPNPVYLQHLANLAHAAAKRGGAVILFMPPLLGGTEAEFLKHPEWPSYLTKTKQVLSDWAKNENIVLIDAGQSEKYGCTADEFTDEHHTTRNCYRKIFSAFWQNAGKPDGSSILQPTRTH